MARLEVLLYPDSRLRELGKPVEKITPEMEKLLNDMAETMYAARGIGLAAGQVGFPHRLIVVDLGADEETGRTGQLYKLVNPEIREKAGTQKTEEGCLSIPGIREFVRRAGKVVVDGRNEKGEKVRIEAEGLFAVCLQHEIDHLNGVLFIDHLSRLKRELLLRQYRKLREEEDLL